MVAEFSAGADADMRRLSEEGATAMAAELRELAATLAGHGSLRPEIDVDRAGDILFFYLSPYSHHMLRRVRGWTAGDGDSLGVPRDRLPAGAARRAPRARVR